MQRVSREIISVLKRLLPKGRALKPVIGSMEGGEYYPAIELNGQFVIEAVNTVPVASSKDDVFLGVDLNDKRQFNLEVQLPQYSKHQSEMEVGV